MKIGMAMMSRGIGARRDSVATIAQAAEALGFDMLAANDHLVVPAAIDSRYPYSPDGQWAGAKVGECLDILVMLAHLAALTERIGLLSSVLVVPHRPALVTAKMLSSIDQLSGGRLTVGCGAGWMEEEFNALGTPPYARRGDVTDEYIQAFRSCWSEERPAFTGEFVRFDNILFEPKGAAAGGPPIWIGGESPAAIRRAGRLGDGWYPCSLNPAFPLADPQALEAGIEDLRRAAERADRNPGEIAMSYFAISPLSTMAERDGAGERQRFTGSSADIAGDIAGFGEIGVSTLVVVLQTADLNETLERMDWFASEVRPLLN